MFCEKSSHFLKREIFSHIIIQGEAMRNLKKYRLQTGKTQKEVADFLGIERSTYAKYESGASEPAFETLRRLAEYFDTSTDELMGFERLISSPPPIDKSALKAAFWGGEKDLSQEELDDMWNDVERFAASLIKERKRKKADRSDDVESPLIPDPRSDHGSEL